MFSALSRGLSISSVYIHGLLLLLYMKLISAILVLTTAISLSGCASLNIPRPSVENAAVLDVVTTGMGLSQGAVELNPLGFAGTTMAKLVYFYILRPEYTVGERREMDRKLASLFTGAAVNNLIQLFWTPSLPVSAAVGLLVGFSAYNANAPEVAEHGQ